MLLPGFTSQFKFKKNLILLGAALLAGYVALKLAAGQSSIQGEGEIYAVIGTMAGVVLFFNGFMRMRLRRIIENIPTSHIRSMALGTVEIAGQAEETEMVLLDPVYKQRCVYFSVTVQEKRGSGKNSRWVTVYDKNSGDAPFYVKDSTGRVLILPHLAENEGGTHLSRSFSRGIFSSSGQSPEELFLSNVAGSWGQRNLSLRIIRKDMPVYVLGFAQSIPQSLRDDYVSDADAAAELKKDKEKMKALDSNSDGHIDGSEWDLGLLQMKRELKNNKIKEAASQEDSLFTQPLFIGAHDDTEFVIASNEKELIDTVAASALWQIGLGPFLTVGSLFYLIKLNF